MMRFRKEPILFFSFLFTLYKLHLDGSKKGYGIENTERE
jgi:hypothetical protein